MNLLEGNKEKFRHVNFDDYRQGVVEELVLLTKVVYSVDLKSEFGVSVGRDLFCGGNEG